MIRINENYTKLKASYLFSDIAKRVSAYVAANPDKPVIRLGIGDVTEPLPPVCTAALHAATDEMAKRETFKGYGPEQGYAFLREAIAEHRSQRGLVVTDDPEGFVLPDRLLAQAEQQMAQIQLYQASLKSRQIELENSSKEEAFHSTAPSTIEIAGRCPTVSSAMGFSSVMMISEFSSCGDQWKWPTGAFSNTVCKKAAKALTK